MNKKSSLIDRAEEVAELRKLLDRTRSVAVVGPGGVGKTTLARHIATSYAQDFPGGVHFIEGYEIGRGSEQIFRPLVAELRKSARRGRTLVVIDGIDEIAPEASTDLLKYVATPEGDTRFLLTSRQPIPQAESTLGLGGLPDEGIGHLLATYGITGPEASRLIGALGGHPLAASLVGSAIQDKVFRPDEILAHLHEFETSGIVQQDGRPLDPQSEPASSLRVEIAYINDELLERLEKNIHLARELSSRKFEELVAELLARQGYTVELTPASKDGGKDIYVAKRDDLGAFLYLVECKKYALENPVGVELVRALYGTVQAERATAGVLVTTSTFTKGAREFQRHVEYQLSLRDYAELHRWISQVLHGGK